MCFGTTACGGSTASEDSSGTASSATAQGGDSAQEGAPAATAPIDTTTGPCGGLELGGAPVTIMNDPSTAPIATGGSILPGTYDLTSDVFHFGENGAASLPTPTQMARAQTLVITSGAAYQAVTDDAKGVAHESGTYTTDGAHVKMQASCGLGSKTALTFSSTRDELRFFRGAGCVEELVFRRRPGT
jgi:hypothetical protein